MVQIPARFPGETLLLELPKALTLYITPEQFAALAAANRDLRLETTAQGELIVNPPTGIETGKRNCEMSGELYLLNYALARILSKVCKTTRHLRVFRSRNPQLTDF